MEVTKKRRALWAVCLSALLWPGAGQIYNKDRVKGVVLIVAAGVAGLAFTFAISAAIVDLARTDPAVLETSGPFALAQRMLNGRGGLLRTSTVALMVLWVVSVVDAYVVAARRAPPES
jgi:TM2 domain-containing membrane protein YozV